MKRTNFENIELKVGDEVEFQSSAGVLVGNVAEIKGKAEIKGGSNRLIYIDKSITGGDMTVVQETDVRKIKSLTGI